MEPLGDGDGYTERELDAAEDRLGLALPAALREALALFGKRPDLCRTMQQLLPPDELHLCDSGLLMFYCENQGVWDCCIRPSDISSDDPPTVLRPDCSHEEHYQSGIPWFERLSTACIAIVLTESLYSRGGALTLYGQLLPDEIAMVEQRFPAAALPSYPAEHVECDTGHQWYVGEDVILSLETYNEPLKHDHPVLPGWDRIGRQSDLHVRARTQEALQSIRESLPTEWFDWRPVYGRA